MQKTVYTTGEAAKICKVSQQTIIRCFDSGQLKGFRVPVTKCVICIDPLDFPVIMMFSQFLHVISVITS